MRILSEFGPRGRFSTVGAVLFVPAIFVVVILCLPPILLFFKWWFILWGFGW